MLRLDKKLFCAASVLLLAGYIAGNRYGCVIKNVFGISCPSCGLTRAYNALLCGDVLLAYRLHPMFYLPPLLIFYCCTKGFVISKRADLVLIAVLVVAYFAVYFMKIF